MDINYRYYEHLGIGVFEFLYDKLNNDDSIETIDTIKTIISKKHLSNFILDLTKVTVIDSVGIGYLIAIKNAAGKKGLTIHLVCDNEFVLKIFAITRVDAFLRFFVGWMMLSNRQGTHKNTVAADNLTGCHVWYFWIYTLLINI